MLYDIYLNFPGYEELRVPDCCPSGAITVLNHNFAIHNIDIVLTKNIFYNIMSRPEKAPKLIRHLIDSGQLRINKKYYSYMHALYNSYWTPLE